MEFIYIAMICEPCGAPLRTTAPINARPDLAAQALVEGHMATCEKDYVRNLATSSPIDTADWLCAQCNGAFPNCDAYSEHVINVHMQFDQVGGSTGSPTKKEHSMARPTKLDRDFMDVVTKWLDDNNHNSPTLWIGFIRKDAQLIWEGVQQAILSTKEG